MFQLTPEEFSGLNSHIKYSKRGGRRKLPFVFTENGVAMLSSVLDHDSKVDELGQTTAKAFKIVFERLDSLEETVYPKVSPSRKRSA